MIGVNLGNWLVLEKWMAPEMFANPAGGSWADEWHLTHGLDPVALRERITTHRDNYVVERDFVYMASHGVTLVRLPVPYFVFGDVDPFLGCIEYVDRAFDWAEKLGMQILLDLHTVPESQNGFDNGGICGVCRFHQFPDHVEFAHTVLERLATRYGKRAGLWGIEVLNEPVSSAAWAKLDVPHRYPAQDPERARGSEPVPTSFLQQFYRDSYRRIRAIAPEARVVFHDGFRLTEWYGFFDSGEFDNITVDTHMYIEMASQRSLDGYASYIHDTFGARVTEASEHFPLLVGEWSLDTRSSELAALPPDGQRDFNQTIAQAHFEAFAPAVAWSYWSWRLQTDSAELQTWDFLNSVERGYLPLPVRHS